MWLHVVSDALIALAYFSIPVTLINSYESFVHVIDSMVNQHAKWLEKCDDVPSQPQDMQYLDMEAAIAHCSKGLGIWNWASNDQGTEPDLGLASCGNVPTLMCLAATALLRKHLAMWHRLGKCQLDSAGKPLRREQTGNPVESVKAKLSPLVNNVGGKKA